MNSNFRHCLEQILDQEKKSQMFLEGAKREKEELIKSEKEKEKKELIDFEEEKRKELQDEKQKLNLTKAQQEKDAEKITIEMDKVKSEYTSHKTKVIDFILENVLDVDLSIPDVVKGGFAEKLLGK